MSEPAPDWLDGRLMRITAVDTYRFGSMEDQIPAASAVASVQPATIFKKLQLTICIYNASLTMSHRSPAPGPTSSSKASNSRAYRSRHSAG